MFSLSKLSARLLKNCPNVSNGKGSYLSVNIFNLSKIHTSRVLSISLSSDASVEKVEKKRLLTEEDNQEFQAVYPQMIECILQVAHPDIRDYMAEMYDYNLRGKFNLRGLFLVKAYKMMEKPQNITEENIKLANIMGWLAEMSAEVLCMSDDVMDQSITRRGRPCWYTKKEIGLNYMNDITLLDNGVYHILTKFCERFPYYIPAMRIFQDVTLKSFMGQSLELLTIKGGRENLDLYSMDKYLAISRLKCGQVVAFAVVALAMHMANITDSALHEKNRKILMEDLSILYQVYNDYMDCYGPFEDSGKLVNEDIRCRRVTWFACTALELANSNQKKLFAEHYGKDDDESVAIIHDIYDQLQLIERSCEWQENALAKIKAEIDQLPPQLTAHRFLIENWRELLSISPV